MYDFLDKNGKELLDLILKFDGITSFSSKRQIKNETICFQDSIRKYSYGIYKSGYYRRIYCYKYNTNMYPLNPKIKNNTILYKDNYTEMLEKLYLYIIKHRNKNLK